jgi:transcriptional regulator with XRE-family HTH domain
VPERGSPNLARRRRLAEELRRLRERARLTGDEVVAILKWPARSKLSRIEQGSSGLKPADLESLLTLYKVTNAHRKELIALAEESRKSGPLQASSTRLPGEYVAFLEAEADAESIRIWEPQVVPGLFQTENYNRAILQAWLNKFPQPSAEVDHRVEALCVRQEVLTRDHPPKVKAIIDESVLHRKIAEASLMSRQLEHLIMMSEMPNVDLRVLPLSASHIIVPCPFNYLKFPRLHEVPLSDTVSVETLAGMQYVGDDEVHQYWAVFDSLSKSALNPEQTRELIGSIINTKWA